jgi:acetyl esterase/lipase
MKHKKIFSLLLCFLMAGCSSLHPIQKESEANSSEKNQIEIEEEIVEPVYSEEALLYDLSYGSLESNTYDLFIPAGLDLTQSQPLMLFLHGGGWISGDKASYDEEALQYTNQGYITASMNYSFIDGAGTDIEAMLQEISACMQAIIIQAKEYGIDINETALSGYSAGGHLSLLYASKYAQNSPLPIRFVFVKCAPVDMRPYSWAEASDSIYLQYIQMLGAEDYQLSISPISYIDENMPPLLLAYAQYDYTIGTQHFNYLQPYLEEYNLDYDLIWYDQSSHALLDNPECDEAYFETALEYALKYFRQDRAQ